MVPDHLVVRWEEKRRSLQTYASQPLMCDDTACREVIRLQNKSYTLPSHFFWCSWRLIYSWNIWAMCGVMDIETQPSSYLNWVESQAKHSWCWDWVAAWSGSLFWNGRDGSLSLCLLSLAWPVPLSLEAIFFRYFLTSHASCMSVLCFSLFQHYRLYEFMFYSTREEIVIGTAVSNMGQSGRTNHLAPLNPEWLKATSGHDCRCVNIA